MIVNIRTLKDIRNFLSEELKGIYPEQEIISIINLVLKTRFGIDRLHMLSFPDQAVPEDTAKAIYEICRELRTGRPVQYILGEAYFYDCTIKVNEKTLIPRQETEELVDLIVKENPTFRGRIIDLGTGSGCIAIALKKNLREAEIFGIDISPEALGVAKKNADLNNVIVSFMEGDILDLHSLSVTQAGIVVSNPPYVMESEKQFMNINVLDFEPHNALFVPDEDPLLHYKSIVSFAGSVLKPGGKLYLEINEKKGYEVNRLLLSAGFHDVQIIKDINGKNRIVKGTLNG